MKNSSKNPRHFPSKKYKNIFGQTMVEYSLLIGIVIAVVVVFSPMVKRGTQGMVKIIADEVGVQNRAEGTPLNATGERDGHLIATQIRTNVDQKQVHSQWRAGSTHSVQVNYAESIGTETATESDLGVRDR